MRHSLAETLLGAFVIATAIIIVAYAFIANNDNSQKSYEVVAHFGRVDGIVRGADVRLAGVKIGHVARTDLDKEFFTSVLHLSINDNIKLPKGAQAAIASEGLLGANFVRITIPELAGDNGDYLQNGGRIEKTTDAVALEDLLGRALFLIGNGNEKGGEQ